MKKIFIPLLVIGIFLTGFAMVHADVSTSTATTQTTTSGAGTSANNNFVPLTTIPGVGAISGLSGSSGLPAFFNSLYKICIGICAAIALLQIIRAGILYMSAGDNTEKVSQARQLISTAILGLVIVLSPVIVFSIINPSILSLNVNFSTIAPSVTAPPSTDTTTTVQSGAPTCTTKYIDGAKLSSANDEACCNLQAGCSEKLSTTNVLNAPTCSCSSN